ncbi:MAG: LLM class flavin-dependent oxidoreductase [Anaerolineae bacterium]
MKFSLRFNNDHSVTSYVGWAQLAESYGFDQFWVSNDLFLRSAPVILTAVALATKSIDIGTCILNPYTINPAEIAMFAATLDELSGGRFNLGLSSGASDFLSWLNIPHDKPRTAVGESLTVLNKLTSGESAAAEGQFLHWSPETYLRFTPQRRVPIYIGAMSPRMLEEIGRIADGGLPLLFPPEHYRNVIPHIRAGAEQANRKLDNIDVAACIWCSISEDRDAALDALKEKIAYYGHAMSATILNELGLIHADFAVIEQQAMRENNLEAAKSLVTDQMLQIGIAGTASDLINRIETLVSMGVRHISFGPPLGPNIEEAIRAIGQNIIPHFRPQTIY